MSARCESAWGTFPRNARVVGSICSASSPTSFVSLTASSISWVAGPSCPLQASASTSQNVQATKAPSLSFDPV